MALKSVNDCLLEDSEEINDDDPVTVTVTTEEHEDTFGAKSTNTVSDVSARIDPFRHTSVPVSYNEKGTTSNHSHIMVSTELTEDDIKVGSLVINGSETYYVTSLTFKEGVCEANLSLQSERT
jgi:hypothetical protein